MDNADRKSGDELTSEISVMNPESETENRKLKTDNGRRPFYVWIISIRSIRLDAAYIIPMVTSREIAPNNRVIYV